MSLHEYLEGRRLAAEDHPFYALIFAALRQADTANAAMIRTAWPELAAEAQARYDAPGALLKGDPGFEEMARRRREMGL
jgi:hypothetical protein